MKLPSILAHLTIGSAMLAAGLPALAQAERPVPPGAFADATFTTAYVRLGLREADALLYRPARGAAQGIALVYVHPNGNTFPEPPGAQMARRGYPIVMVNYHGDDAERDDAFGPAISQAIRYARALPGVRKVVLVGHSGGGHLTTFYTNVALNGPGACSGPEKLYPCAAERATGLEKPDGLILLDPTLGTLHQANAIDPAAEAGKRDAALDMFATANGFDAATKSARYAPGFVMGFHSAQAARSTRITAAALARLRLINSGKGPYRDDEPLVIPGMGNLAAGARLFQPDTRLLSRTQGVYATLKADGSLAMGPIRSVRPAMGQDPGALGTLAQMTRNTTVRNYLATSAIRLSPDFAMTEDDITGVDWKSGMASTPGNAEGVTVPTLVLTMSCHYLVVPDEIVFRHLAARDKTLMAVEGATHLFAACRPEYGDTTKRTFDAVAAWLAQDGRF